MSALHSRGAESISVLISVNTALVLVQRPHAATLVCIQLLARVRRSVLVLVQLATLVTTLDGRG
jgi:hypothetical protein